MGDFEIPADKLPKVVERKHKTDKTGRTVSAKSRAKADPEDRGIGDNSKGTPEDTLVLGFLWSVMALEIDENSLKGRRRALFKQAKADGVDTVIAKRVLKELKSDTDEMVDEHNRINAYRALFDLPHSVEMRSEASIIKDTDRIALAGREGARAAYRGAGTDAMTKYEPGSPEGQMWITRYGDAIDKVRKATKPAVLNKVVSAAAEREEE